MTFIINFYTINSLFRVVLLSALYLGNLGYFYELYPETTPGNWQLPKIHRRNPQQVR